MQPSDSPDASPMARSSLADGYLRAETFLNRPPVPPRTGGASDPWDRVVRGPDFTKDETGVSQVTGPSVCLRAVARDPAG